MVGQFEWRTLARGIGWSRGNAIRVTALLMLAVLLMPGPAESQFLPSPCCAILSTGLGTISNTLYSVIGGALNTIRTALTSIDSFQRAVVRPQVLIDRARAAVGAIDRIFDDIQALGQIPVARETLP